VVNVAAQATDVIGIANTNSSKAAFTRFFKANFNGSAHGDLAESPVAINNGGERIFADDFDFDIGEDVVAFYGCKVLWDADDAMRVVAGAIGISKQIRDELCILAGQACCLDDTGAYVDDLFFGECGHDSPCVSPFGKGGNIARHEFKKATPESITYSG